jgi:hypothetical protein
MGIVRSLVCCGLRAAGCWVGVAMYPCRVFEHLKTCMRGGTPFLPASLALLVRGTLCFPLAWTGCRFAKLRLLPIASVGDLFVVHTAGAHSHSMGFQVQWPPRHTGDHPRRPLLLPCPRSLPLPPPTHLASSVKYSLVVVECPCPFTGCVTTRPSPRPPPPSPCGPIQYNGKTRPPELLLRPSGAVVLMYVTGGMTFAVCQW